jgi:hypothetical protein
MRVQANMRIIYNTSHIEQRSLYKNRAEDDITNTAGMDHYETLLTM